MYKELLKILYCPICKSEFKVKEIELMNDEIIEGTLICEEGHKYSIHKGVIDFCSEEQSMANQWSEAYKENDYESYDEQIESMKSDKEKAQQKKVLDHLVNELSKMEKGTIVDIASGRGMLLTQLAANVKDSINIIATDLSFDVLMYDRLKLKKIRPNLHVDFIACDAANMPFKSGSIDSAVSFFGIANMLGIVESGMKEASRILNDNGKLLDAFLLIREDSKGFEALKHVCAENKITGAEKAYLESNVTQMHKNYFGNVHCDIVCEDIKDMEENRIDLLPYPGEWFAEVIYQCTKIVL